MKNFVFLSPNFPENYWHFCKELKNNGINVLGIGDAPYDNLSQDLKNSLNEYYKVSSLENYDEVYKAVAFFAFKYGRIDFIESNNEYWLERDAHLRDDFNVTTGFRTKDMNKVKFKSKMKPYYQKAGLKTAAYYIVKDIDGCRDFIKEYGYPVIAKPDNGVGANDTHKITCEEDLYHFFETKLDLSYIMEEYIDAEVCSFDAIVNSKGNVIFCTGNVSPISIMDIVNNQGNSIFYIVKELAEDVKEAGLKTVKSFGVKRRFVHFEFFRLTKDQRIGKKGEVIALEVNMRPSGGVSPDMMNYANSIDVYKVWADMIAYDKTDVQKGNAYFCSFVGRRDAKNYLYSEDEICQRYRSNIKSVNRVANALSGAMGNKMYLATFDTKEQMNDFVKYVIEE